LRQPGIEALGENAKKENTADEVDLLKKDQMRQNASARRGASENNIRNSSENINTAQSSI